MASTTKFQQVATLLNEEITAGGYQPGDRLPSHGELCTRFGVARNTLDRVLGIVEEQGLIRREKGRGIFISEPGRRPSTGLIGLLGSLNRNNRLTTCHYNQHLLEGVKAGLRQSGRSLLLFDPLVEQPLKVDGLLTANVHDQERFMAKLPPATPFVSLLAPASGRNFSAVTADDFGGAHLAVRHLIELGHRRIGILLEPKYALQELRLAGYRDALTYAGVQPLAAWLRRPPYIAGAECDYLAWGRRAMEEWLADGWEEAGCTALIAQNDSVALGASNVLQAAGYRIPDDVSLIGFDGTEVCDFATPPLCAVGIPLYEIGEAGALLLCRLLDGEAIPGLTISLPMQLRLRASTAPPPETAPHAVNQLEASLI
jgi:DNA-binding LacI/PurR family transcriptional regulator